MKWFFRMAAPAAFVFLCFVAAPPVHASAAPDQVLVLYNADWTEDLDGGAPGQDSEEVARYYVERHTDPVTGRKPFLLGLSCAHEGKKHLDDFRMKEEKGDNELGLVFNGRGALPGGIVVPSSMSALQGISMGAVSGDTVTIGLYDARLGGVDAKKVRIRIGALEDAEANPIVYDGGKCLKEDWVSEKGGTWTIRTVAFAEGRMHFWFMGPNDKDEAHTFLRGLFRTQPAAPPAAPQNVWALWRMTYPSIAVDQKTCANPDAGSYTLKVAAEDDPAKAKVVYPAELAADAEPAMWLAGSGRSVFLRPYAFGQGTQVVWLSGKGADGAEFTEKATFFDVRDFQASPVGADGVPDDKYYLEDIALPVKRFLEDPANKTPDGKLLKDHILYIVPCYGLPLQVRSAYGVRRGTLSGGVGDAGNGGSLEQRLAMLYYNDLPYLRPTVLVQRASGGPLPTVATAMRGCLTGRAQPYRHPWALVDGIPNRPDVIPPQAQMPPFTSELRAQMGEHALYLAMRVDNYHPNLAKAQVDSAIYASRYLTSKLDGAIKRGAYRQGALGAREVSALGFDIKPPELDDPRRVLFFFGIFGYGRQARELEMAYLKKGAQPTFGLKPMPPGGTGYAVRSGECWRSRTRSQFGYYQEKALEAGITMGGGDALGAHITSHSWWDDQVFYHHLLRGYDAAEALYMSTMYVGWITYYVGDPLYHPDLTKNAQDVMPPMLKPPMKFDVTFGEGKSGAWARIGCELQQTPVNPEMAEISVEYWSASKPTEKRTAAAWRYLTAPQVTLGGLQPGVTYNYRVRLIDPYGNTFDSNDVMAAACAFTVPRNLAPAKPVGDVTIAGADDQDGRLKADSLLKLIDPAQRGELHVYYTVDEESDRSLSPLRGWGGMNFTGNSMKGLGFSAGGASVETGTVLFNRADRENWRTSEFQTRKGREYHVVLRWSREPLMREISVVAPDGAEVLLGANNFIPWRPVTKDQPQQGGFALAPADQSKCTVKRLVLYNRVDPPPAEHSAVIPPMIDGDLLVKAGVIAPEPPAPQ